MKNQKIFEDIFEYFSQEMSFLKHSNYKKIFSKIVSIISFYMKCKHISEIKTKFQERW